MLTTFEDDTKFRGEWLVYLKTGPTTRETEEFTGRNLMKFNNKCKVLYFGQKNPPVQTREQLAALLHYREKTRRSWWTAS